MENKATILNPKSFNIERHHDCLSNDLIHFSVTHPQLSSKGFGTHESEKVAIKIAINECLERQMFHELSNSLGAKTSTGFAAHNTFEEAAEASLCELLERDAFLCTWLTKTPIHWLEKNTLEPKITNQVDIFEFHNFKINLGQIATSNNRFCLIGMLTCPNKRFGSVTSTSCNKNITDGLFSICKELRRGASVLINTKFKENDKPATSASYHFNYYVRNENFKKNFLIDEIDCKSTPTNDFQINTTPLIPTYHPPWDFFMAYSQSKDVQRFYFNNPQFSNINRRRLRQLWSVGKKLNKHLHPLP